MNKYEHVEICLLECQAVQETLSYTVEEDTFPIGPKSIRKMEMDTGNYLLDKNNTQGGAFYLGFYK